MADSDSGSGSTSASVSGYNHQARGIPFKPSSDEPERSHRDILKNLSDPIRGRGNSSKSSVERSHSSSSKQSQSNSSHIHDDNHTLKPRDSYSDFSVKSEDHHASSASQFLSSVLTVAQNAASSLAGLKNESINGNRTRSSSESSYLQKKNDDVESIGDTSMGVYHGDSRKLDEVKIEPVRSTISTMGQGELSLATLGLSKESRSNSQNKHGSPLANSETKRLLSASEPVSKVSTPASEMVRSSSPAGEPEFNLPEFHSNKFKRVASVMDPVGVVRSVSMTRNRSRRGTNKSMERPPARTVSSSNVTSITDSNDTFDDDDSPEDTTPSGFSEPSGGDHNHMTGFAYANPKRNREFHRLFKSVQPDDYLLDDFNCALSKEILIQGKMYISERHVCFNSNILGWVTNLIIAFDEIVTMDKKLTAGLFPNGIVIQTLHARHSFASFVNRDSVLDFLMNIWRKSSSHQPTGGLDTSGIKMSDSDSSEDSDKERDRDDDLDDVGSFSSYGSSGELISDEMETDEEFGESARDINDGNGSKEVNGVKSKEPTVSGGSAAIPGEAGTGPTTGAGSWPVPNDGPETHSPTDLPPLDAAEKQLASETINAPLGVVANLLFGPDSSWYRRFLTENQKNIKLDEIPNFKQEGSAKTRHYEYVKPLSGPVGPKQTRCICTDTIDKWDLENCVIINTAVSSPDVPSGGSFVTKSKTGLCWSADNGTKIVLSYHIEWSAKSWLKGPIEKGALDGQTQYVKDLILEINSTLKASKSKRKGSVPTTKPKKNGKRKRKEKKQVVIEEAQKPKGLLGTINGMLTDTSISMIPLPNWALLIICLMIYFVINWVFFSASVPTEAERMKLMRIEEEFQIWNWFEDRGRVGYPVEKPSHGLDDSNILQYPIFRQDGYEKIVGQKGSYSQQELYEAIRITEHRLNLLKDRLNIS